MMALTGVGALSGSILTGYGTSSLRSTGIQILLYALCFGTFASTTDWRVALAAQMFSGFFYFWLMTSMQTLLQES